MPILEYLKLLFYSVSDSVLMTLQKVLKPRIRPLQKAAKISFLLSFLQTELCHWISIRLCTHGASFDLLEQPTMITTYSQACSRLRDSWVRENWERANTKIKQEPWPFSQTNHALLFSRALHLGVIPTIWDPGTGYTWSNRSLRTSLYYAHLNYFVSGERKPLHLFLNSARLIWTPC